MMKSKGFSKAHIAMKAAAATSYAAPASSHHASGQAGSTGYYYYYYPVEEHKGQVEGGSGGLDLAGPILIAVLVGVGIILLVAAAAAIANDDDNNARKLATSLLPAQLDQLLHHEQLGQVAAMAMRAINKRW
ncbi:hypothetical protein FJT64_014355 [Amphibalanus amphitrite]|uniref:Uncharacterized protein n=1 Tax=Amphibalanus amphitrite TaxID=1232801 RepID=A0A6A4V224_AMPAM|nr:hypothetical protein FJT64_014355 [Amphibalanus amphitrite]